MNADDEDEAFGDDDEDGSHDESRRRRRKPPDGRSAGHGAAAVNLEDLDPLSLQNRADRLRRQLDILEEVSEKSHSCVTAG